jgi:transposase InsO family protein
MRGEIPNSPLVLQQNEDGDHNHLDADHCQNRPSNSEPDQFAGADQKQRELKQHEHELGNDAKGRLWLNDGSCIRLRPAHRDHVWSYDFVHHRTDDGRAFRTLNIIDEFTRESLAIRVKRKLNSTDVIDVLTDLFILRGVAAYIRSDNGPEFVADAVRRWINAAFDVSAYGTD